MIVEIQMREVVSVVNQIKLILAGCAPEVQGATLADLLAIWLAGHHVEGDSMATRQLRGDLLASHLLMVEELMKGGDRRSKEFLPLKFKREDAVKKTGFGNTTTARQATVIALNAKIIGTTL